MGWSRLKPGDNQQSQADQRDNVADYTIDRPPQMDVYIAVSPGHGNNDQAGDIGCLRFGGLAVYDDIPRWVIEKANSYILRRGSVDGEVLFRLSPRRDVALNRRSCVGADAGQILVQLVGVGTGGDGPYEWQRH